MGDQLAGKIKNTNYSIANGRIEKDKYFLYFYENDALDLQIILNNLGYTVTKSIYTQRVNVESPIEKHFLKIDWSTPKNIESSTDKKYIYYFTDKTFKNFIIDNKITYNNKTYVGEQSLNNYSYNSVTLNNPVSSTLSSNFWFITNTALPQEIEFTPIISNDKFDISNVKYKYVEYESGIEKNVNGTLSSLNNIPLTAYMNDISEKYQGELSNLYNNAGSAPTVNIPSNITFSNLPALVKANNIIIDANIENTAAQKTELTNTINSAKTKYESAKPKMLELTISFISEINNKLTTADLQQGRKMLF